MKGFRHSGDRRFSPRTGFPPPPAGRRADTLRAADASWRNLREKIIILGENPTFPCRSRPPRQPLAASLLPKGKQRSDLEETHHSSSSSGMPQPPRRGCWRAQAGGKHCSRGDRTTLLTSKILMAFVLFPIPCYLHSFFFN